MATRFLCSFDYYDTTALKADWITSGDLGPDIYTALNGSCARLRPSVTRDKMFKTVTPEGVATLTVGFRFLQTADIGYQRAAIIAVGDSAVTHLFLVLNTDGSLSFDRSWSTYTGQHFALTNGTTLGTSAALITQNVPAYIEIQVTISATVGVAKLYVDGLATSVQLTGQNTLCAGTGATATASWIGFQAMDYGGAGHRYVDEIYVNDSAGAVNTGFEGDVRTDPHFPVTPNGSDRTWTRSTGADDYPLVDEVPPNTTDYLSSTTVGDRVSLHVEPLRISSGLIYAVSAMAYLTKMDAGLTVVKPYVLRGGTRYYGGEWHPVWGRWCTFRYVWDQDPAAGPGAWTEANYNASEFGLERTT
jgi:hypothetical protein